MVIDGVTFAPAYCSKCGEQLCLIAVPAEWDGSKILLTTSHYCREGIYEGTVLWEELQKKGKA